MSVAAVACEDEPVPPPKDLTFSVTARPEAEIERFGDIVPMTFTITNENAVPAYLLRVEVVTGSRREIWVAPTSGSPIAPGESLELPAVSYRIIERTEKLLITYEGVGPEEPKKGTGIEQMARAVIDIPCPAVPFDPNLWDRKYEAWTYSTSLGGFVFRLNPNVFLLAAAEGDSTLPPLVFELLRDVDEHPARDVGVLMTNGRVRQVNAGNLRAFLDEIRAAGRRILFSNQPDLAPYEVKE